MEQQLIGQPSCVCETVESFAGVSAGLPGTGSGRRRGGGFGHRRQRGVRLPAVSLSSRGYGCDVRHSTGWARQPQSLVTETWNLFSFFFRPRDRVSSLDVESYHQRWARKYCCTPVFIMQSPVVWAIQADRQTDSVMMCHIFTWKTGYKSPRNPPIDADILLKDRSEKRKV